MTSTDAERIALVLSTLGRLWSAEETRRQHRMLANALGMTDREIREVFQHADERVAQPGVADQAAIADAQRVVIEAAQRRYQRTRAPEFSASDALADASTDPVVAEAIGVLGTSQAAIIYASAYFAAARATDAPPDDDGTDGDGHGQP